MRRITDLRKLLKLPSRWVGDNFVEIPRSDGVFDRLKQRILADALRAAQHQRVVDLLAGSLHPMRQPANDMRGIVGIDRVHVVEPGSGLIGVTQLESAAVGRC